MAERDSLTPSPRGPRLRRLTAILSGLVAAMAFHACAGSRTAGPTATLPDEFPNHTTQEIVTRVRGRADTLQSFRARASVVVSSAEQRARFGSTIEHRRRDSLYMNVKVFLGMEAARALVTPDSFFVYDRIKKKLYYGDISIAERALPIPIATDAIFETMLGLQTVTDQPLLLHADSAYYHLSSVDAVNDYTVDPTNWRVVRYVQHTPAGQIYEERRYSEFDEFDGVVLPRRVFVRRPEDSLAVSVFYSRIDLSPGELNFDLRYSDRAERIEVR